MNGKTCENAAIRLPLEGVTITGRRGQNLLEALRENNLPITAVCGGRGVCGKCAVKINGGEPALACDTIIEGDMSVEIAGRDADFEILREYSQIERSGGLDDSKGFAIAVDLGTTTVVAQLIEKASGTAVATRSFVNGQRRFGADVITRIQSAGEGNLHALSGIITASISGAAIDLCADANISPESVAELQIAGNTTMIHLLLEQNCHSLGQYPFLPELELKESYSYEEIFHNNFLTCDVKIWPWISAFVGGDIVAGLEYCAQKQPEDSVWLLVDMGTNGEMALCSGGEYLCTSTAAGPAFEGGNIEFGMGGIAGAISCVEYENKTFKVKTIGGAPAVGICGSGVLDAAACLVSGEIVDENGLLDDDYFDDGVTLATMPDGAPIVFTQKDVRELQLAKSAVRAGIEILIEECGCSYDRIDAVYLSGGFGQNLSVKSAVTIGLLPPQLAEKVQPCGNSALGGCALGCQRNELLKHGADIAGRSRELNLSAHSRFNTLFMEYMGF